MPATVTSNYLQQGQFSGPLGTPITQGFFDAAFAGRIDENPIYREAYYCDIIGKCDISEWLDEFTASDTDCNPAFSVLESHSLNQQIQVQTTVVVPVYPGTANIKLAANSHYVSGAYVLPQIGNSIVLSPTGELAKVTALVHATANDTYITVQLRNTSATAQTVTAGDRLMVLSGSEIEDCACPTGQFAFNDLPIEHELEMFEWGDKGELCGDALNKCQHLKIPFMDDCGNVLEERWYNEPLQKMYRRFEERKAYERLLNPNFGMIPTLKARGIKFTPASANEITTDDVRAWKAGLDEAGIACREYAVWAGGELFSQYQRMLLAAGVVQLDASQQPLNNCKWLNMEWCGIKVEGMTLHIYELCSFSSGKLLGGPNMVYPMSAIWIPMCERTTNCKGGNDNKMLTTVYFKSLDGRVWDRITDSNGILNGPNGRNTFGTGCEEHEFTIKGRMTQIIHCAEQWGYQGLN